MARTELQYAGEFVLDVCMVHTVSGLVFDIGELVESINIYEDIFSMTVSGDITIKDTTNITMLGSITGQEKLSLRIFTPQENASEDTVIDFVDTPLNLYKVNSFTGSGENANIVSFNFTTSESQRNQLTRVSQSYTGTPSDIITKIIRDQNYLNSKKKLFVETTSNSVKMVVPNLKPFDAINRLTKLSNSQTANSSPSYLFYETTKGFHFETIDNLCSQPSKFDYSENIPNVLNSQGVIDPVNNLQTINSVQVMGVKDTIKNLNEGTYSSELKVHDIFNKNIKSYTYNYLGQYDKDTHTSINPTISSSTDRVDNKNICDHKNSKLFVTTTSADKSFYDSESKSYPYQSDNYENIIQRRKSRINQIKDSYMLTLDVAGQTFLQSGDTVDITIGSTTTLSDQKFDTNYSGKYLITAISHNFTIGSDRRHKIQMQVAKDSLVSKLPSAGVDYEDFGKSITVQS